MQITHMTIDISENVIYLFFAIIKQNHFKMHMFGVVGETRLFEVISFYNSKDI